jgi:simple sugar transport system ATP-binding protein
MPVRSTIRSRRSAFVSSFEHSAQTMSESVQMGAEHQAMRPTPSPSGAPLLELQGVEKRFGPVVALNGIDCSIAQGEVVGLLGDNGAGKSTLIKILAGVHQPDSGEIRWNGERIVLKKPAAAIALGISVAYQHLAIVEQMSVWRNLFLGREAEVSHTFGPLRGPLRMLRPNYAKDRGREALSSLGIRISDVDVNVEKLSGGQRQSIAIARAVIFESKLLILDEPTSALSLTQAERVFEYVRSARDLGISVIIITHNVRHAMAVSDSFAVLHRGAVALRCRREEANEQKLSDVITTGRLS